MSELNRRNVLAATGIAALAGSARADTGAKSPADARPAVKDRLLARALENVHALSFDGHDFAGPAWDFILGEARGSEMVLLGEEHGTAEIPVFARQLYLALRPSGFDTLAIEISPPIADDLDRAARGGVAGIADFIAAYPPGPAFYFWKAEAELIAAVRAATPGGRPALWGLDYEVTGDRRLIARLKAKAPASARVALSAVEAASNDAWAAWRTTHNPGALFTFSGDPRLIARLRDAWPRRDADTDTILSTLEETLEINRLWPGKGFESNQRRARFNRANLVTHLQAAAAQGRAPKVMFKMGETHMMRGVTTTGQFDIGSLAAEVAALRGGRAFSIIAGGGRDARHGVLNPTDMSTADAPASMLGEYMGLRFLIDAVAGRNPVVVDLRPLREIVSSPARIAALGDSEAVRAIFAYDAVLIWNGSTAAHRLVEA